MENITFKKDSNVPEEENKTSLTPDQELQYDKLLAAADPDLVRAVSKEDKINGLKKLVLGIGLVGSQMAAGMDADTPKNFETLDTNYPDKEITFEQNIEPTDNISNPFDMDLDNNALIKNIDSGKEKISAEKESKDNTVEEVFEIDITTSFELGNAVMTSQKQEEMKLKLANFFDSLPQEIKNKIKSGETVINIESGSSPEPIIETGINSGRSIVYNNEELSIDRAEAAAEPTESALKLVNLDAEINFTIPKGGVNLDNPVRYVRVSIQDISTPDTDIQDSNTPETFKSLGLEDPFLLQNMPSGILESIYIDGSASMEGKAARLFNALKKGGYIDASVKFQLGSGLGEISRQEVVETVDDVKEIDKMLRKEKDFSSREETFSNAKILLDRMPLVKYEYKGKEPIKIVTFLTDEYLNISDREISSLERREESHGAKLVFFMENRESGEITSFTLEKIKELYKANARNGEKLSFDVNKNKIEYNKEIDIYVEKSA